jgi:DNA-binding MarR family transcriptional regulator
MAPSTHTDTQAAARAFNAGLGQFGTVYADFPRAWMCAFLYVVERGDCRLSDLQEVLGLPQSSVSIIVLALSSGRAPNKEGGTEGDRGLDLLETFPDPEDRRAKRVRLTPRGKRIANALRDAWLRFAQPVNA